MRFTCQGRDPPVPAAGAEAPAIATGEPMMAARRLGVVVVIDGLRPTSITRADTPVLHALAEEGARGTRGRAVVPAVTRVNAATMVTGHQPTATGVTGNLLYVPEVDAAAFTTADARNLLRLRERTGAIVQTRTLADVVEASGGRYVAVGSGSSGCALCLAPTAPDGTGTMINADDPRKGAPLAFPTYVGEEVERRFGPPPAKGVAETNDASVDYITDVVTEYVLPALDPDVLVVWMTEPDSAQHRHGVGSSAALRAIRGSDRNLGRLVDALRSHRAVDALDLFVVSDHGFSRATHVVDVAAELRAAGLARPGSGDVVVARTGSAGLFVADPEHAERVVAWLQRQPWVDALFTAASGPGSPYGWIDGTLARDLIGSAHPARSPDVLVTMPWVVGPDEGTASYAGSDGTGPPAPGRSDHGSMSPCDLATTFVAWGDGIASVESDVPVGNVDLAPTLLALRGQHEAAARLDGRVAEELLVGGPSPDGVPVVSETHTASSADGGYRAEVSVSAVDGRRYVDQARRLPVPGA